jgi:hypothetical protein
MFRLIERVNLDQIEIETTSKRGWAVLMSKGRIRLAGRDGLPASLTDECPATPQGD